MTKKDEHRGGLGWIPLGLAEFRAYLSICLLMGVKKLPPTRLYWSIENPLLNCSVISQIMTYDRFGTSNDVYMWKMHHTAPGSVH
jgi:hypothetical protein